MTALSAADLARLAAIKEREAKATPKWADTADEHGNRFLVVDNGYVYGIRGDDISFAAHNRDDIPWLLATVERLAAEIKVLDAECDDASVTANKWADERDWQWKRAEAAEAALAEAKATLAEAYQVVGSLADIAGLFHDPGVQKALDLIHDPRWGDSSESMLPFVPKRNPLSEANAEIARLRDELARKEALS